MQMWEQINTLGRGAWKSLIELNRISARSIERAAQQEAAFLGDCATLVVHRIQASMRAKHGPNTLRDEVRLATTYAEKWMANAHWMWEISLQTQHELGQWLNDILHRWDGEKVKTDPPSRRALCLLDGEKNAFVVDDPMLALISRFACGEGQLQLSQGEFLLDQIAAIQRYVTLFPAEQRNRRALEWIEEHAKRYRQAWQRKAVYERATQTRCPDCPMAEEGLTDHCAIHHRWLDLLNRYTAGEVSSRRYVEDTLRLLTDYRTRLKVSTLRGVRGTGQRVPAGWRLPQGIAKTDQGSVDNPEVD
jgi:hypothetical protein